MTAWHAGPLFAWDLETTAPDPEDARIVTATAVWIHGAQTEAREWLVNPGVPIPDEAAAIHGVTTEKAQTEGMPPATAALEVWDTIRDAWTAGRPVIGFNLSYDFTVLDRELRRHGLGSVDVIGGPVLDGHVIDKHLDKWRKGKRTLTATCLHYGVRLDGAHDATQDALAAARLIWRLAQVYPEQLGDLALVNELQAQWRASWAVEFESYLTKKGTPEKIDGSWPLRRLAVA